MRQEDHVTGYTGTANQINTTCEADEETPWYDTVGMTSPVCKQMVTQLHVYQESIKKNLKGADYTNQTNGFATRTDNFVAIPYITSANILFGYLR